MKNKKKSSALLGLRSQSDVGLLAWHFDGLISFMEDFVSLFSFHTRLNHALVAQLPIDRRGYFMFTR